MKNTIIANWKMSASLEGVHAYVSTFKSLKIPKDRDIIFCPPTPYLTFMDGALSGMPLYIGAQDCAASQKISNTGEASADMLKDVGCSHVIVGHSEVRQRTNPTQKDISAKLQNAIDSGLHPIFCVGESLEIYKINKTKDHLEEQLKALDALAKEKAPLKNILIAYEPIWAIGTGIIPTMTEIEDICAFIAEHISKTYNIAIPVLYGGSVKGKNAGEILSLPSVNGVLVGGASLDPKEFHKICMAD